MFGLSVEKRRSSHCCQSWDVGEYCSLVTDIIYGPESWVLKAREMRRGVFDIRFIYIYNYFFSR